MKWINGETWKTKKIRLSNWHKWYAWHPATIGTVIVDSKTRGIKVWLDYVERKGKYYIDYEGCGWWDWEYREISK